MISYEQIKNWCKEKDNQQKMVLGVCFVLVFIIGFGAGRYVRETSRNNYQPQTNYTTQQSKKLSPFVSKEGDNQPAKQAVATTTGTPDSTCIVKGNISSSGKKIYHVQGGAFYKIVKPEQCFDTEAQALAAGFVKSSR
jgi:hypothetical protein